eukprot:TRINITY_DN26473_c0_g1_i2.p1 TRINITY_DN26473_c0_g1~~TRINITY_DN26473_c0_g1_i2.p1  ORF type:complete len:654 (-),score=66.53 TRINITY_DN26473_c0_g1_i2:302-2170(-)
MMPGRSAPQRRLGVVRKRQSSGDGPLLMFLVTCPETTHGQHVRVVGGHPALGQWQAEKSLVVLRTGPQEFPLWRSDWVSLPPIAMAGGEAYKYVICDDSGKQCKWEKGPLRLLPPQPHHGFCSSSERSASAALNITVRDIFNRVEATMLTATPRLPVHPQEPLRVVSDGNDQKVQVSFALQCSSTVVGDRIVVVGQQRQFGRWRPESSLVELFTTRTDFPLWRSQWIDVAIDEFDGELAEYKYVVMSAKSDGADVWEEGTNRRLQLNDVQTREDNCSKHLSVIDVFNRVPEQITSRQLLVSFAVECRDVRLGDHLVVVGAPAELGKWDASASLIKLRTSPEDFPVWRSGAVVVDLDQLDTDDAATEYQYVIVGPDGNNWEPRGRRHLPLTCTVAELVGRRVVVTDVFSSQTEGAFRLESPRQPAVQRTQSSRMRRSSVRRKERRATAVPASSVQANVPQGCESVQEEDSQQCEQSSVNPHQGPVQGAPAPEASDQSIVGDLLPAALVSLTSESSLTDIHSCIDSPRSRRSAFDSPALGPVRHVKHPSHRRGVESPRSTDVDASASFAGSDAGGDESDWSSGCYEVAVGKRPSRRGASTVASKSASRSSSSGPPVVAPNVRAC